MGIECNYTNKEISIATFQEGTFTCKFFLLCTMHMYMYFRLHMGAYMYMCVWVNSSFYIAVHIIAYSIGCIYMYMSTAQRITQPHLGLVHMKAASPHRYIVPSTGTCTYVLYSYMITLCLQCTCMYIAAVKTIYTRTHCYCCTCELHV